MDEVDGRSGLSAHGLQTVMVMLSFTKEVGIRDLIPHGGQRHKPVNYSQLFHARIECHAGSVGAITPHLSMQTFVPPLTSWAVTGGTCEKPLDEASSHLVTVMLFGLHPQT